MPNSKVYFVGLCEDEKKRFQDLLSGWDLCFLKTLADVPREAELLSISISEEICREFLQDHPSLRMIATRTTSSDHIDADYCAEKGIEICNVEDYGENTVAEHVFALLLALTRRLRACYDGVRLGKMDKQEFRGMDLFGKTLGVLGCGRVGLHVIRAAAGFRMRVLGNDSNPHPFHTELLDFVYTDLETVLRESDILSLHLPLNSHTANLLNHETLARCKPGVIIINTARGGLLDMEAAMEGLESGHIGGLGLDVLEDESVFHGGASNILSRQIAERVRVAQDERGGRPTTRLEEIRNLVRSHRVLQHPRVVFTPHTAYNSYEAMERICFLTANNLRAFQERKNPSQSGK